MTNYAGGDIIKDNEIMEKIRCPGHHEDGRPCNKWLILGSPGFDIYGKPKRQEIKCKSCKQTIVITCEIEERVIVRVKE